MHTMPPLPVGVSEGLRDLRRVGVRSSELDDAEDVALADCFGLRLNDGEKLPLKLWTAGNENTRPGMGMGPGVGDTGIV